jgi:hypothetical protein
MSTIKEFTARPVDMAVANAILDASRDMANERLRDDALKAVEARQHSKPTRWRRRVIAIFKKAVKNLRA